jgi:hypothetical protein
MSTESDRITQSKYKCLAADKWSRYPATHDVNMGCNDINQFESMTFCDGTYMGPGGSFDISSSHNIEITSAGTTFTVGGVPDVLDISSQGIRPPYILDALGRGAAGQILTSAGPNNEWVWGTGGNGTLTTIIAGTNITVDNTNPIAPIISSSPTEHELIFNAGSISAVTAQSYYFGSIVGTPPSTTPNVPRVQFRSPYTGTISTVYLQSYMTNVGTTTDISFSVINNTTVISKLITSSFNFSAPAITKYTLSSPLIVTKDDLLGISFSLTESQPSLIGLVLQATAIITVV